MGEGLQDVGGPAPPLIGVGEQSGAGLAGERGSGLIRDSRGSWWAGLDRERGFRRLAGRLCSLFG